jgi:hypothetical protein
MIKERNGNHVAEKSGGSVVHSFEPRDPIEVETPHGLGIVLYITVYGVHGNDMWCVANKADGRMRHYDTTQLKLAYNGVLNLNCPSR